MADVAIIGGGLGGLSAALLLAGDGHEVTVLERDPNPPPTSADEAWDTWERKGVNQFRMIHYFLPRFREAVERELPAVAQALDDDGVLRLNPLAGIPPERIGGFHESDNRFEAMTGRRPMVEAAIARVVDTTPGITVRRGTAVRGLLTDRSPGGATPHVVGVSLDGGEEVSTELLVDAAGRRSALPAMLTAIGARPVVEKREDSGFMYYGRYYRSPDGVTPPSIGPLLQHYDSFSTLTLPADNGTWGMGIVTRGGDAELRPAREPAVWERIIAGCPLVAHWLDGEPMTDVEIMAKIEDRHRSFVVDGLPVATGVVALADSWACTNPSVGRGATIGMVHAVAFRDLLRTHDAADRVGFSRAWHDATQREVEPLYRDTLVFDRHRLAEMDAQIAGRTYETDDPPWLAMRGMAAGSSSDPDVLRAFVDVVSAFTTTEEVIARPGLGDRILEIGAAPTEPLPGPTRSELVALVST